MRLLVSERWKKMQSTHGERMSEEILNCQCDFNEKHNCHCAWSEVENIIECFNYKDCECPCHIEVIEK